MEQCKDCDGGFYCSVEAATNITALCAAGYYCESGVDRPNPNNMELNSTYLPECPLLGGHTGEVRGQVVVTEGHGQMHPCCFVSLGHIWLYPFVC